MLPRGALWEVQWRDAAQPGVGGRVWLTADARYVSRRPVLLHAEITRLRAARARVRCLQARGVRVVAQVGSPGLAGVQALLGPFAASLVIRCGGAKLPACGAGVLPRWISAEGARTGVLDAATLQRVWGCR